MIATMSQTGEWSRFAASHVENLRADTCKKVCSSGQPAVKHKTKSPGITAFSAQEQLKTLSGLSTPPDHPSTGHNQENTMDCFTVRVATALRASQQV